MSIRCVVPEWLVKFGHAPVALRVCTPLQLSSALQRANAQHERGMEGR